RFNLPDRRATGSACRAGWSWRSCRASGNPKNAPYSDAADKRSAPLHENILQSVGQTPLVRLRRVTEGLSVPVYVKVEFSNPAGSIKDRVAVAMVSDAERRGLLRAGGTIIEATAGNTGLGLAMVAAVRGYRCIFVLPDKMSKEKISLLKAYGAEV